MKRRTLVIASVTAAVLIGATAVATARPGSWNDCMPGGKSGFMPHNGDRVTMACTGGLQKKFSFMLGRAAATLTLTEDQQARLAAARAAVDGSHAATRATCAEIDFSTPAASPVEQMRRIEVGLSAATQAIQAINPAVTDFFTSLSPEQQSQLQPQPRRGWRR